MKSLYSRFISLFINFFKLIDENIQFTFIKNVFIDEFGFAKVAVSSLTALAEYSIYPHLILRKNILKNQFHNKDINVVKSIIISEGDIFILAKNYIDNNKILHLKSVITNQTWNLSLTEVISNKELYNRLNKRFFEKNLKA